MITRPHKPRRFVKRIVSRAMGTGKNATKTAASTPKTYPYGAPGSKEHYQHFLAERQKLIAAGKHANPSVDPRVEYAAHLQSGNWSSGYSAGGAKYGLNAANAPRTGAAQGRTRAWNMA